MMKNYEKPEMEIVIINNFVLTASVGCGTPGCGTETPEICALGHTPSPGCSTDMYVQ